MAFAGNKAALYLTGKALTTTSEAMTDSGDGLRFKVSNPAKGFWDWTQAVEVYEGGTPVAPSSYKVNYLFGEVVFNSAPSGAVTADFGYLPSYQFAKGREVEFERSYEELDATVFMDEDEQKIYGLGDVNGSITSLDIFYNPIGSGESSLRQIVQDREFVILSYKPHVEEAYEIRAVIMFDTLTLEQAVDSIVEGTVSFVGAGPRSLGGAQVVMEFSNT